MLSPVSRKANATDSYMEYDDQIDITCIQIRKCCEVTATKKDTSGDLHAF